MSFMSSWPLLAVALVELPPPFNLPFLWWSLFSRAVHHHDSQKALQTLCSNANDKEEGNGSQSQETVILAGQSSKAVKLRKELKKRFTSFSSSADTATNSSIENFPLNPPIVLAGPKGCGKRSNVEEIL